MSEREQACPTGGGAGAVGVSGCGGSAVEVDETPDCCSSHLFQIESFFSGTMMIGPVAPMICTGAAAGSSRLPLFCQGSGLPVVQYWKEFSFRKVF